MPTKKSTRGGANPPPALPLDIALPKIKCLPLSTIRLYLNQYHHLVEAGNKATAAKRLYDYLQAQASSEHNSKSSSSEEEQNATYSGSGRDDNSSGEDSEATAAPFTDAQQEALTKARRSALAADATKGRKRHRTPAISPPSSSSSAESVTRERKSRAPTRPKRARHSRHYTSSSSSSPSTSPSSSSSSGSSSDRHHHSRKSHHRRRHCHHHGWNAGQHQRHTPPVPCKVRSAIQRGEFVDLNKLVCEHLTLVGSARASRTNRSLSTRCITGLDTWLEKPGAFLQAFSATISLSSLRNFFSIKAL